MYIVEYIINIVMVFLFVPNIIGYLRFLTLIACFFTYLTNPILTAVLYFISQGLDFVDGEAARHLNQCSRFGAVLDMTCDRAGDAAFLAICAWCFP